MTVIERLRDKALSLPKTPGVYIMKNKDGAVIYIGKAKRLKNRVISYFTDTHHTPKTARMIAQVQDFDTILCGTEIEALTLENVLIKKHAPKYNIRLKDDKSYPYIKVTKEEYPHLFVTRMRESDKAHYFGPYSGMSGAYGALETVMRIFSLASCKRSFPRDIGKERPCIYKEMGRCVAPCTGKVSAQEYGALVRSAMEVLGGRVKNTRALLEEKMLAAAENLHFEQAAKLRDRIKAIDALSEKQKVVSDASVDRDVFALYSDETECVMAVLSVCEGLLINKNTFHLSGEAITEEENLISLVAAYYEMAAAIPKQILLDFSVENENLSLLSEYLSLCAGRRIEVRIPERGDGRALCQMAVENAKEAAKQHRLDSEREDKNLQKFAEVLGLPRPPRRIEAYDISNIGNESITASMVVWEDGRLKKSDYRFFHIKTTDGADDYGAMRECLTRRLSHLGDGTPSLQTEPDLILLDGGAAHTHVGKEVLASLSLSIPIFGMVKDDFHKTRALTDGDKEISIALSHGVYSFIYKLQEEAHRFAVKNTMASKGRTLTHSSLEKIKGIGPAKAKRLLSAMALSEIRTATAQQLAAVKGITKDDARAIASYYQTKRTGEKKK